MLNKPLESNNLILINKNLLYVSTPKCASTSLKWFIKDCISEDNFDLLSSESSSALKIHDYFPTHLSSYLIKDQQFLLRFLNSNKSQIFAVVRNPFNRIFSAWQNKILLNDPQFIDQWSSHNFFSKEIYCFQDILNSFHDFIKYLSDKNPEYYDWHWVPQHIYLDYNLVKYHKIFNTSDFSNIAFNYMKKSMSLNFKNKTKITRRNKYDFNESFINPDQQFFDNQSLNILSKIYDLDIKYFKFDKPYYKKNIYSDGEIKYLIKSINIIRDKNHIIHSFLKKSRIIVKEKKHHTYLKDLKKNIASLTRFIK